MAGFAPNLVTGSCRRRNHLWQIFWWSVKGGRICGEEEGGRKSVIPIDKSRCH